MAEIIRKLATIERISKIRPIPDADLIECATIRGWNVVIRKDEFKVGDYVVYCEIDSVMPERPEFEFLRPRGFRIRTIKLKGQISQGIIFPFSILPQEYTMSPEIPYVESMDVTEVLGVTKYDPPLPAELAGQAKGFFPSHSIKTDEERIQNLLDNYEDLKKEEWIATEKLDGTSMTVSLIKGEFGVSSRNLELYETEGNTFWKVARALDLERRMKLCMDVDGMNSLTLQGELIGEGIQGNKYKIKGQTVRWFRAFNPETKQFIPFWQFKAMISYMNLTDGIPLETVPIIDMKFHLPEKIEDLILYADGNSKLVEGPREGIVFVSNLSNGDNGRLSFKVISNKFILKTEK
jgi:RNA ligase (TIGR02306 family)